MTNLTFVVDETTNNSPDPQFVQDNKNQVVREYSITVTERSADDFDSQISALSQELTSLLGQDQGMTSSLAQNASQEKALQTKITQIQADKATFIAQFPN